MCCCFSFYIIFALYFQGNLGATLYPYGPEEDPEDIDVWKNGVETQALIKLEPGAAINFNCKHHRRIFVSENM